MTLPDLITHVQSATSWPAVDIDTLVQRNWPDREAFSPTQAALVVSLIRRREAKGEVRA